MYVLIVLIACAISKSDGQAAQNPVSNAVLSTLTQVISCAATEEPPADPDIGTFPKSAAYCNPLPTCYRGLLCCAAMPADQVIYQYTLWTSPADKGTKINWRDAGEASKMSACSQIVYVVHGFMENYDEVSWMPAVKDGWVKKGSCVITVDWRLGNQVNYFSAIANVRVVGATMGFSAAKWAIGAKTLFVGFSLGGQTIGEAARYYTIHSGGKKIPHCHGLDPAGPGYDGCDKSITLQPGDCDNVQVVHSDANIAPVVPVITGFGTKFPSGKCDWWINGGFTQGACPATINFWDFVKATKELLAGNSSPIVGFTIETAFCSHYRAPLAYASVLNGQCSPPISGVPCPDCGNFAAPPPADAGSPGTPMVMDFACPSKASFFVKTTDATPYCP